ncbi:hypothetical protein EC957_002236 [Mortierella hygrophila]|uniref:Secreted protein n=1 Tax=Mortierella hygrophila TaxID=979708 RepID=A0A9P6F5B2_9FUNG|nr:hypothetical protein EC957_002236 [Mortierella hygrophila]
MKVASFSLGLAVIVFVAAHAGDPMAANDPQTTYQWAEQEVDHNDLVYQLEEAYSQISELEFRALFLSRPEQKVDIEASAVADGGELSAEFTCATGFKINQAALQEVIKALKTISIPGVMPISALMDKIAGLSATSQNVRPSDMGGTVLAIDSVLSMLNVIASRTPGLLPPAIPQALKNIKERLASMHTCSTVAPASIEQASCFEIADLYRSIVADVQANVPVIPADASEDLQRYSAGAQAILQIISKNSIAAKNEALLASRPIFAAELLDAYRIEMVRAGAKDDVQSYVVNSLSFVIGSSNALEACLRIAADPAAAVEDLNDELDALEDEDEYDEDDEPEAADAAEPHTETLAA